MSTENDFPINEFDEKWLEMFYSRVTNQYTLSRQSLHNTHQWAISLSLAIITAVLSLRIKENVYPTQEGLIILLVSFPLLVRFFIRSCLECSIQHKWQSIRDALDIFFILKNSSNGKKQSQDYLFENIKLYYFEWKSPKNTCSIVLENLKLAYLWPFLIWCIMIVWAFRSIEITQIIKVVSIIVFLYLVFELILFSTYHGFECKNTTTKKPII